MSTESRPDPDGAHRAGRKSRTSAAKSWLARLKDPEQAKQISAGWLQAWREDKDWCRARKMAHDQMDDARREDTPLEQVDRSSCERLFALKRKHFPRQLAEPLGYFLKRWKRSDLMRQQMGYREKAALAASSRGNFDGPRYCNCRRGRLCGQVHHCPRCAYDLVIQPTLEEYAHVFEKAPYWFASVPSITYQADRAGLHYVVSKDAEGRAKKYRHHRPFVGRRTLRAITLDGAESDVLDRLLRVPFEFAKRLLAKKHRGVEMVDGALATREIALDFVPCPHEQLQVGEVVIPHGNILFDSRHRLGWRFALECWETYLALWKDLGLYKYGYPDLVIGQRMKDQDEIDRWISYELKAMPFEKFYKNGIKNGCRLEHLNFHFDQTIFRGVKMAFTGVRSPRKFGNMNSDPRKSAHEIPPHRRYIGKKPANRMAKRIIGKLARCLKRNPPKNLFDVLSKNEIQFLATHGLDGKATTFEALKRLETEY